MKFISALLLAGKIAEVSAWTYAHCEVAQADGMMGPLLFKQKSDRQRINIGAP